MTKEPIRFEYAGARFTCEVVERTAAPAQPRADLYVQVDERPRQLVGSVSPGLAARDAEALVVEWYDGF